MIGICLKSVLNYAGGVLLAYFASCWLFADVLESKLRNRFPLRKS